MFQRVRSRSLLRRLTRRLTRTTYSFNLLGRRRKHFVYASLCGGLWVAVWPYPGERKEAEDMDFQISADPNHIGNIKHYGITVIAYGNSSRELVLTLTNETSEGKTIKIPRGTFFENTSAKHQPLLTVEDTTVTLDPGKTQQIVLNTLCGKRNLKFPSGNRMEPTNLVYKPYRGTEQSILWNLLEQSVREHAQKRDKRLENLRMTQLKEEEERQKAEEKTKKAQEKYFDEKKETGIRRL